ncbi:hypothetical protein TPHA_0G01640 [Tetrapisispora phaffii CBS 4417]|uniref:Uncharacterized protein n=1 Tax=Tetrapisispora phaffii (strain ATCC 24235 / CBS 4417 / NBRC 1672 / NRRL Y-8282 / UCD 70-5) TaxID=1071381 RepID=G8BVS2_TETPH|nr:hypothetical protein TPHA_0G01640 [Tetrapisispora phaffii CBS 4417]CCE64000.1 hypothetical protein TPHA_0G01640 [Tetrapisispora phaffii CBS 4417]
MIPELIKVEETVPNSFLWQNDGNIESDIDVFNAPDKTHLLFGVFNLDRYNTGQSMERLNEVLRLINAHLSTWNNNYPWSEYNPIQVTIESFETFPGCFIKGQICVEDNIIEEEKIIVALLQEISNLLSVNEFIRVCDTTGDFILSVCNENIPEEYEYPIANNRLWIHEGKFKMIPLSFYPDRGLKPTEALEFLSKAYFKCCQIKALNNQIDEYFIKKFPDNILSNMVSMPLYFENTNDYKLFTKNKQIVCFLIKTLLIDNIVDIDITSSPVSDEIIKSNVIIPKEFSNLLSLFLDKKNLKKEKSSIPVYCSRILLRIIKMLTSNKELQVRSNDTTSNDSEFFSSSKNIFDTYKFKKISLEGPVETAGTVDTELEFMNQFPDYLKVATQDMDELNLDKPELNVDSISSSDSHESSTLDDDIDARNYFKKTI